MSGKSRTRALVIVAGLLQVNKAFMIMSVARKTYGNSPRPVKMIDEKRFERRVLTFVLACALPAACVPNVRGAQGNALPHLRKQGTATQLVVDGRPFLIRGGERPDAPGPTPASPAGRLRHPAHQALPPSLRLCANLSSDK